MDCKIALTVKLTAPQNNGLIISYSSSSTPFTYASGWNDIFESADNTNCPISSCSLMDGLC